MNILEETRKLYGFLGYKYIDVPVNVPKKVNQITFKGQYINFVGSAEQSFIYLILQGKLQKGRYQATTYCLRDEPKVDVLHLNIFLKTELISINPVSVKEELFNIIMSAYAILSNYFKDITIVKTEIGYDLEINGVEIGSYGIRNFCNNTIIYGTGIALPRFWQAINRSIK